MKERLQRTLGKVGSSVDAGRRTGRVLDQAVHAALAAAPVDELHDVVGFTRFLHEAFGPARDQVETLRPVQGTDEHALRWRALLEAVATDVPPVPVGATLRIGAAQDRLATDATPFVRERWVADVGMHSRLSSSSAHVGRVLMLLVRMLRPGTVLEIGTAYGVGSLFIAEALRGAVGSGHLHTLEISQPQADVARETLRAYEDIVHLRTGDPSDLLIDTVRDVGRFQLVFHDGEHSGAAYERDFHTVVDALEPGSVFFLDDIRWSSETFGAADPRTYEGWQAVVAHPRVRAAVELSGRRGLVLV